MQPTSIHSPVIAIAMEHPLPPQIIPYSVDRFTGDANHPRHLSMRDRKPNVNPVGRRFTVLFAEVAQESNDSLTGVKYGKFLELGLQIQYLTLHHPHHFSCDVWVFNQQFIECPATDCVQNAWCQHFRRCRVRARIEKPDMRKHLATTEDIHDVLSALLVDLVDLDETTLDEKYTLPFLPLEKHRVSSFIPPFHHQGTDAAQFVWRQVRKQFNIPQDFQLFAAHPGHLTVSASRLFSPKTIFPEIHHCAALTEGLQPTTLSVKPGRLLLEPAVMMEREKRRKFRGARPEEMPPFASFFGFACANRPR
jgi:hypothetical protein